MRKVTNVLKERVLINIDDIYYDSWGGIYLNSPKKYIDIPELKLTKKNKLRHLAFELIDESLMLFEISCLYDDNQVYFKKDILTAYVYDEKSKSIYSTMNDIIFDMEEVLWGKDDLQRFIINILSNESYFNTLVQNRLIIFDEISIKNIFFIYKNKMNFLIELFIEKELFNVLALMVNSKVNINMKLENKNWQLALPLLTAIEKSNNENNMNVLNKEFEEGRDSIPDVLEIVSNFSDVFTPQDIQAISRFIEVLNKACGKIRAEYNRNSLKERHLIKILNILESLNFIGTNNKNLTEILNYVVKSIFNTYQCALGLNDIEKFLKLYSDYISMREDVDNNELELYPVSLEKAHNELIAIFNNKTVKLNRDEKIAFDKNVKSAKVYEYQNDKYIIKAPTSYIELLNEGKSLNHCVGGYSKAVSKGYTNILFVRYKVEESVPFMTLEVKRNQIVQAKKKGNKYPTDEENKFLEEYAKIKGLTIVGY